MIFDIDVEDKDSGIRSVIADINGTEVINKDYTKEEKTKKVHDKLTVNTDAVEKENESNDGLYRLTVTVFDNAGNSSTITQDIYKDNKRPVIENITFSAGKEENSKWDDLLNLLTFGIFFNDDVKITVDGYDPDVSAGIKEYNLFVGGKLYASTDDGVFNISYDAYNEALASSNRGSAKLSFNIVDNVNNTCDQVIPSVDMSNAKSPVLVLEKEAPYSYVAIPFSSNDEANYFYDEVNNRHWYSGDITSIITAADAESGIRNITATINGTEVLNENYYDRDSAVKEQDVTINTSAGKPDYTGAYELKAVVTDNAGNVSEESVRTVYIDKTSPIITSMLFTDERGNNIEIGDIISYDESAQTYIISCQKSATITMFITDPGYSSGVNLSSGRDCFVSTMFTPIDGEPFVPEESNITCEIDDSDPEHIIYVWKYTLSSDFKGAISAVATDNVGNSCEQINPGSFIIETPEQHKLETDHITMSLDNYGYGHYYNHTVTPVISIKDTFSGIKDVEIVITANGKNYKNTTVKNITQESLNGWIDIETDKNHVDKASIAIPVNIESNNIVISIKLTDNSNNVSEAKYMFHIDLTAPVISCELSSSATPYNRYYSSAVTATITVNEHNFNPNLFNITEGSVGEWTQNGDVWTAKATYSAEGAHQFTISVADKAGNVGSNGGSEGTFYVDNTNPTITVSNIALNQATNNEDVSFNITASDALCLAASPLNVSFTVWYKTTEAGHEKLTSQQFTIDQLKNMGFISVAESASSTSYTYIITLENTEIDNDGVYSFDCTVQDMSGRTSNTINCSNVEQTAENVSTFEFSLNRHGSTYMICWENESGDISTWDAVDSSIVENPANIIIREYNPTAIKTDVTGTKISMFDGVDLVNVNVTPEKDANQKFGVYTYEISKADYFNADGVYDLRIESVDEAGNVSDGSTKNFSAASFTVDSTAPVIKTDIEDAMSIEAAAYAFSIGVEDLTDCKLTVTVDGEIATVTLPDKTTAKAENLSLDSDTKSVTLELSGSIDEISVKAEDYLKHVTTKVFSSITISTNRLTLLFANLSTWFSRNTWGYAIIVGVPVVVVSVCVIAAKRKAKKTQK